MAGASSFPSPVTPKSTDDHLDSLILPVVTAEAKSIFLEEVARAIQKNLSLYALMGPVGIEQITLRLNY